MKVACIGWGSLIWCQKALPVAGHWQPDGPYLPIEFARQSNDDRITLVVTDGAACVRTLWVHLGVPSIDHAREVLATREGISPKNAARSIGFWTAETSSGHAVARTIGDWANARGLEGVVWTALKPKFDGQFRTPSLAEVIGHLTKLAGTGRVRAEEYVRMAPRQIESPYRTAIEQEFDWTPAGLI